ncbi:TPA: hypothetical protein EYP26_02115, partial [Candidatus Bathyarchaeota archaeon]|nr:hypothetical protein [Candidatus Bathyarchaeota archaeon]
MAKEKKSIFDELNILKLLSEFQEIELEDVEFKIGDLELWFQPAVAAPAPAKLPAPPTKIKPKEILKEEFHPPVMEYPGRIVEVKIGATKGEGGTRGKTV